uniref:arginine repressor n=1 Tax=Ndongobacter massiliensis TaxID=1871025 RepID=UPI0009313924|nr:arginine repressor [Ndongobacter massiliensis]
MNKYNRQRIILDIISSSPVKTQDELSDKLRDRGVRATQATISRDIKELRITKVQTRDGEYQYVALDTVFDSMNDRMAKIFRSAVLSVHDNGQMIIVQTIAYTATVVGWTITNAKIDGIAGILTGHDTIFIAVDNKKDIDRIVLQIQELMK